MTDKPWTLYDSARHQVWGGAFESDAQARRWRRNAGLPAHIILRLDWNEDIDEAGQPVGSCPRCGLEVRPEMGARTHESIWRCAACDP